MHAYLAALLIGVIAGLRTFTAPAAVSWAAYFGALPLAGTRLAFFRAGLTPYIFTALVIWECIFDQLPRVPSRKSPPQLVGRVVSGALCGAAVVMPHSSWVLGLWEGAIGALLGTFLGYYLRVRLARVVGRDRPVAIGEDVVAIVGAVLIVTLLA